MIKEKICRQCRESKSLSEYYWHGITLNAKCKACVREYNKTHVRKRRNDEVNINAAYGCVS